MNGQPRITLDATPVRVQVPLTETAVGTLRSVAREPARKVFLRIDDIRTEKPPSFYYAIYLDPPAGQNLDPHTPGFVGNLSLFSLVPHRIPGGKAMEGDVFVDYDISPLAGQMLDRIPARFPWFWSRKAAWPVPTANRSQCPRRLPALQGACA